MSINTDWDVDYYKTDYESEEHWELRRSFMMAHKDKFGEDELVCLAQVFTNVEFMGCRYPEVTMRRVGMLSQEVAAEFRKSRAMKLKRTFVGAQDAAGAKAKGRSKNCEFRTSILTSSPFLICSIRWMFCRKKWRSRHTQVDRRL